MTHPRSGNWSTHASVYLTWLVPTVVVVLLAFFQPWVGTPVSFKDVVVVAGGIIPDQDRAALLDMGVKAVFGPGTPTPDIVEFVRAAVAERDSGTYL